MNRSAPGSCAPIALFGGTFDPVHFGHLRAAVEAQEILDVEDFRLLPSGTPALRPDTHASARHRLAMLQLAVEGRSGLRVDDRETRRSGKSYMADTLRELRQEAPQSPLMLLIGQDAANALDKWHEWKSLFELSHLVIMRRPDSAVSWTGEVGRQMEKRLVDAAQELREKPAGLVLPLEVTQLAISSTDIRRRLHSGQSASYLLPASVIQYIEQNRLYFAGTTGKG